jgi:4-hydroxybenzoate polyprenyltransferase
MVARRLVTRDVGAICAGMAAIAADLAWQVWRIDLQRPELSFRLFLSNILTGVLLACSALVGTW